jgi:hypothetical protein
LGWTAWWAWRKRPDWRTGSALALLVAILASPLATPRFTVFLLPPLFSESRYNRALIPASLLLIPTSLVVWLGFQSAQLRLVVGFVYPFALIGLTILLFKRGDWSRDFMKPNLNNPPP